MAMNATMMHRDDIPAAVMPAIRVRNVTTIAKGATKDGLIGAGAAMTRKGGMLGKKSIPDKMSSVQ